LDFIVIGNALVALASVLIQGLIPGPQRKYVIQVELTS
jgi:hypothetical protein